MSPPAKRSKTASESDLPYNYKEWTVDNVYTYLSKKGLEDEAECLKTNKIDGKKLLGLTEEQLKEIGLVTTGQRLKLQEICHELKSRDISYKIFNDPIHGHIEMHPLCISIIDTVQFQRLRQIKQMGGCYYVYPGASHNRFEHSLGVSYLAGKQARILKDRQPELNITAEDILCVEIAGLCHDLGHGPFSHMFDAMFIPRVLPNSEWKHEQASIKMFDHLVKENNLVEKFELHNLNEKDRIFIKEQIYMDKEKIKKKEYEGRPKKTFLYEIVANKVNGIDVDKSDYFERDCLMLGIKNSFDYSRFMKFTKVIKVNDQYQICTRDKEVGNLYDMFHTRNNLHRRACQHKVTKVIEVMIVDALVKANKYLLFKGTDEKDFTMSEAIEDMTAYTKMTDNVMYDILNTSDENLFPARKIIRDILTRNLYKCVGQTNPKENKLLQESIPEYKKELLECNTNNLKPENLEFHLIDYNYGMDSEDPIESVGFYTKHNPDKAFKIRKHEVSGMLPEKVSEQQIRLYCKLYDEKSIQDAATCFKRWCEGRGWKYMEGNVEPDLTPYKTNQIADRPEQVSTVKKRLMNE
ncbi:deoxynucleoside triphosphate triphosphohydrolase SAMHD1-like [Antedon mediterranea]|uniref:deoxynucleoside triphosphate triphosphohydrolase SAMHD1-like n=1 Tax=Antedon mediterranea TaxID=105859 RepID=UPI003AF78ED3